MVALNLDYKRFLTQDGQDPLQLFSWAKYNVSIRDSDGRVLSENKDVKCPVTWTPSARNIVGTKYFYHGNGLDHQEKGVDQLVSRVSDSISKYALRQGLLSDSESRVLGDELKTLGLGQYYSFNSPVWFNVGLYDRYGVREKSDDSSSHWAFMPDGSYSNHIDAYDRPQSSACFIQSIDDNLQSILMHGQKEGMLFKFGSGTGTNYSSLRGIEEPLSGGGVASGSISFMRIFDIVAGRIQSGGKTRRAAKMVILDDDHPDIFRFIHWKVAEEKKALWLSMNPAWSPRYPHDLESEAYRTVDGQNGNNSVRLKDNFMDAALNNREWSLWFRTKDRFPVETDVPLEQYKDDKSLPDKRFIKRLTNKRKIVNAGELLEQIARAAAVVGDPGVQYDDNINRWNTCKNSGRINASNPCSEFMFLDDTACNLASINLTQLRRDDYPVINPELLRHIVRTSIYSQEALVDQSSYPSKEIAENSHKFRPLGLGYTNLGAFLMEMGVPYDSEEGRSIAAVVTSLMTAYAYQTSAEIASKVGTFEEYDKNREPMLEVIRMHADAAKKIIKNSKVKGLNDLIEESRKAWETVSQIGEQHGFRNAQVTLLAPTGTISFMMDADCTGIEPMIGLETTKGLAGGGEIKRSLALCVTKGLQSLGYNASQIEKIVEYVNEHKSVVGAPELDRDHYKVFETALGDEDPISVDGHLNMMAAVQPFLSGAISKTVNLPRGSTVQDIKDTYIKAWKLGLKSVCPYVDQSKGIQPVTVSSLRGNGKTEPKWGQRVKPTGVYGELGPIERFSFSVEIDRTPVHIIFGDYQNRPPKEAFADYFVAFGGSGSPLSAHVEDWAKAGSRSRQRGEPFDEFVRHNVGSVGTIRGFTNHPFIKTCTGIADFVAKLAALEYQANTDYCDVKPTSEQIEELRCNVLARRRREEHYRSRIRFIDHVMEKGEVMPIVPLYEDNIQPREIRMGQEFCIRCGSKTVLSGANCRRCENCGDAGACG